MEPVRTCLGCRERAGASALLRVVARNGEVLADPSASLDGRGAWVHPTFQCVDTAIARKAFSRALRVEGVLNTDGIRATVGASTEAPQRRFTEKRHKEQAD